MSEAATAAGDRVRSGSPWRRSPSRWFRTVGWRHLIGLCFVVISVFPLLYVVSTSLDDSGTLVGSNDLFSTITLDNYRDLLSDPQKPFLRWVGNTVLVGVSVALGTVLLSAMAAYAFSRYHFVGRRAGLNALVLLQVFPPFLGLIAIFLMLDAIGEAVPALGLGSIAGLIAVYLGGALGSNTYLMYGYFNTIPTSLFEAAKIDGAGHARVFFRITLPLAAPILVIVGMLVYVAIAGEFAIASISLDRTTDQTAAVGLYGLISTLRSDNWGRFSAGAVLTAIPLMALFIYAQRFIVSGLFAGSAK